MPYMQHVLFASSNAAKIEQFQYVADAYKFNVEIISVYQQSPAVLPYSEEYTTQWEIVENGAREIYGHIQAPVVVEDSVLEVDALRGLPGLRSNAYLKEKGRAGLLHDIQSVKNRAARITSIVGYFDGTVFVASKRVVEGQIATKESYLPGEPTWVGPTYHSLGGGFNALFITNASHKTLADHTAKEGLVYGYREPNFKTILGLLT